MYYNLHLVRVYVADGVCFYLCTRCTACAARNIFISAFCVITGYHGAFSVACVCMHARCLSECVHTGLLHLFIPIDHFKLPWLVLLKIRCWKISHHYWNGYSCTSSNCMIRICKLSDKVPFWRWTQQVYFWLLEHLKKLWMYPHSVVGV